MFKKLLGAAQRRMSERGSEFRNLFESYCHSRSVHNLSVKFSKTSLRCFLDLIAAQPFLSLSTEAVMAITQLINPKKNG